MRVIEAGPSVELCGGTHVRRLGDIGAVKVLGETSIGSNIRRVEAITGFDVVDRLREREQLLRTAASRLSVPVEDLIEGLDRRLAELRDLQAELKSLRRQAAIGQVEGLVAQLDGGVVVARVEGVERDELRDLAFAVRDRPGVNGVVLAGATIDGRVAMVAAVRKDTGLHAGELIKEAARW